MAKGKLSGMQSSGMQRASKRKQEEDQERKKQQARQEQQSSADRYSKANRSATSDRKSGTGTGTSGTGTLKPWQKRTPMRYQKPGRSTADTEREIAGPEKLPNYIDAGQEPGKPEKLPYRPAESKAGVRPLGYSPFAGTAADVRQYTGSGASAAVRGAAAGSGTMTDWLMARYKERKAAEETQKPGPASPFRGAADEIRQYTDGGTGGTVRKPGEKAGSATTEKPKTGYASFVDDEEADEGVEEQPEKPKQSGTAPTNTALDDYLSEQEALRKASDPEWQALASAAAEAQAAFEKLDSQDKTWWGPMDWDSYNRAQTEASVAQRKLDQYDIAAGRGITASGLQAEAADAPEGFAPDPETDWAEAAREKAKEEIAADRDALLEEYNDIKYKIQFGRIGTDYTTEDVERFNELEERLQNYDKELATMQRADADPVRSAALGAYTGLEQAGYSVTQVLDWMGGEDSIPWAFIKEVGTLVGADLEGKNPITALKKKGAAEVAYWAGRTAEASAGNDTTEAIAQHATSIAQSAPFIVMNLMTMGGAGATTEGLEYMSTILQSEGMESVRAMALQGMKALASDPSAQYSFAVTFGSSYDEAQEEGASPAEATLYAVLNGAWNAMIEVGGGDEALGGMQALPGDVREALARGDRNVLLDYAKSVVGEVNEEEWQGFIERGLKAIYQDVAIYSEEDPNAILNPEVFWETMKNTAIDTAISAGAQTSLQYALDPSLRQEEAAPLNEAQMAAEQAAGQRAQPVEGLSTEEQRAEQRAQRAASEAENEADQSAAEYVREQTDSGGEVITPGGKVIAPESRSARSAEYENTAPETVTEDVASKNYTDLRTKTKATLGQIKSFIQNAFNLANTFGYIKVSDISPELAEKLRGAGMDVTEGSHALRDNDLRHIRKSHGDLSDDKYKVSAADIANVPYIIDHYDNLYQGYDTNSGNPTVVYEYSDGTRTFYVEEVLDEGTLSSKQMLIVGAKSRPSFLKKYKKISSSSTDTDVAVQDRATGISPPGNHVPDAIEPAGSEENSSKSSVAQSGTDVNEQARFGQTDSDSAPTVSEEAYGAKKETLNRVELRRGGSADVTGLAYDEESGELQLRTRKSGETEETLVPLSDAELTDEQTELIGTLQDVLGPEQAAHAFSIMGRDQDAGSFAKAYALVRNVFGRAGANMEEAAKSTLARGLSATQFEHAYLAGQQMREALDSRQGKAFTGTGSVRFDGGTVDGIRLAPVTEDLSGLDVKLAEEVARVSGVDIVFFQSEADENGNYRGDNGLYKDGTVYLDIHAGMNNTEDGLARRALGLTLSHEVTHLIQEHAPAQYEELRSYVTTTLVREMGADFQTLVEARMRQGLSYDAAVDEVTANACERVLLNAAAAQRLAQTKPTLFQTIRNYVVRLLRRMKARSAEAKTMEPLLDELTEIWVKGFRTATDRNRAGEGTNKNAARKDGAKRMVREEFASELKEWYNNATEDQRTTAPGYIKTGTISDVLRSIGVKEGSLYWRKYKIGTILEDHPKLSIDDLASVPEMLEHPVLVMKSRTVDDSIVVFGDLHTPAGDPIMAAVELKPKAGGGTEAEFALISSAYDRSKDNVRNLIQNSEILYLDSNKKRTDSWLMQLRVQFPSRQSIYGSIGSIAYEGDTVKISGKAFDELGGIILPKDNGTKHSRRETSRTDRELLLEAAGKKGAGKELKEYAKAARAEERLEQKLEKQEQQLAALKEKSGKTPGLEELTTRAERSEKALREADEALRQARRAFTPQMEENAMRGDRYARGLQSTLERAQAKQRRAEEKNNADWNALGRAKEAAAERTKLSREIRRTEEALRKAGEKTEALEAGKAVQRAAEAAREAFWNKDVSQAARENRELREANRRLQRELDFYREQARIADPEEKRVRPDDVRRLAGALLEEHESGAERGWLESRLQAMGDYLVSNNRGRGLNAGELNRMAGETAETLLRNSGEGETARYSAEEISEMLPYVRDEILDAVMSRDVRQADTAMERSAKQAIRSAQAEAAEAKRQLKQERATRDEQVRRKVEQLRNRQEESRQIQSTKRSIERIRRKLTRELTENSAKHHIPDVMKNDVSRVLLSLDTLGPFASEARVQEYLDEMDRIRQIAAGQSRYLEEQGESGETVLDLPEELGDALQHHINEVREALKSDKSWKLSRMNLAQLRELEQILTVINTSVNNANILLTEPGRFKTASEAGEATIHELDGMRERVRTSPLGDKMRRFIAWNNTTPFYAFRRMGEGGRAMFKSLTKGWGELAVKAKEIIEFSEKAYTAKEAKDWEKATHEFELHRRLQDIGEGEAETETVTLSEAQIMELWCLWRREQAQQHLAGAGIKIGEMRKGGVTIRRAGNYLLSTEDIATILSTLSERQKEVCRTLQHYMNTTGSAWGNEVSMKRYGIRSFTEENYWPIRTDSNSRDVRTPESDRGNLFRLLNQSFTKNTVRNANNAIELGSVFDSFANHMADMAKYNALALPMLDSMRWFNYRTRSEANEKGQFTSESVRLSLDKAWGKEATGYFQTLMEDLNGNEEAGRGEDLLRRMASNFKVASVGANLRVALQQPTSIVRAALVIDPQYLARGAAMKGGTKKAMTYSGLAVWKSLGYYDTNINRGLREQIKHTDGFFDRLREKSMILAEKGDKMTWGALWNACEIETREKSGLKGEELMQATAERFDEVIMATQVMDSTLTRSQNMRSKSGLMSEFTAFMAEPTLTFNTIMDAAVQLEEETRRTDAATAARKCAPTVARTALVFASSSAMTALFAAIGDAFRDDDEYESWLEKLTEHTLDNFKGNLDPTQLIPIVKDAVNIVLRGDTKDMMAVGTLEKARQAYEIWEETWQLAHGMLDKPTKTTSFGRMTTFGKIYKTLDALGRATGLPAAPAARELQAAWNASAAVLWPELKLKTYDAGAEREIQDAYLAGYLDREGAAAKLMEQGYAITDEEASKKIFKWEQGEAGIYDAVKKAALLDDEAAFDKACEEMTAAGYEDKEIRSAVRGAIKDRYQGADEGAKVLGKQDAIRALQTYGGKDRSEAEALVQEWTCFVVTGMSFDKIGDYLLAGAVSEKRAAEMWELYGGMEKEAAACKAAATLFKDEHAAELPDLKQETVAAALDQEVRRGSITAQRAETIWRGIGPNWKKSWAQYMGKK